VPVVNRNVSDAQGPWFWSSCSSLIRVLFHRLPWLVAGRESTKMLTGWGRQGEPVQSLTGHEPSSPSLRSSHPIVVFGEPDATLPGSRKASGSSDLSLGQRLDVLPTGAVGEDRPLATRAGWRPTQGRVCLGLGDGPHTTALRAGKGRGSLMVSCRGWTAARRGRSAATSPRGARSCQQKAPRVPSPGMDPYLEGPAPLAGVPPPAGCRPGRAAFGPPLSQEGPPGPSSADVVFRGQTRRAMGNTRRNTLRSVRGPMRAS